jgi:hypothetical protein
MLSHLAKKFSGGILSTNIGDRLKQFLLVEFAIMNDQIQISNALGVQLFLDLMI